MCAAARSARVRRVLGAFGACSRGATLSCRTAARACTGTPERSKYLLPPTARHRLKSGLLSLFFRVTALRVPLVLVWSERKFYCLCTM